MPDFHPIALLDLIAFLTTLAGLVFLCKNWKRTFLQEAKFLFVGLILFTLCYNLFLFLEWSSLVTGYEIPENFIGALLPMWWVFVIYAFLQEMVEQELRKSEARYQDLYDNAPDMFVSVDAATATILHCNRMLETVTGYAPGEILGQPVWKLYPVSFHEKIKKVFETFRKTGEVKDVELQLQHRDGSGVDVILNASAVRDKQGQILYSRSIFRDITERKKTEQTLRFTQFAVDHASDAAFWIGPDAKFVYVNQAACQKLGYSREELLTLRALDVNPDFSPESWPQHWQTLKEKTTLMFEAHHRTKMGDIFPVEITASFVEFEGKEYNCVFARDITERKQAEEALQVSEQRLRIRNKIARIFLTVNNPEVFSEVLEAILEAMESKYGVFGYIDEHGDLACPSMTRDVWEKCQMPEKSVVFPRDSWGDSLWCRAIREKRSFYTNQSSKVPAGHIPIERNLVVPIIHKQEVIGIIHVANKSRDYNDQDVEFMEDIVHFIIAPVLYEKVLEDRQEKARKRAEQALQESEAKYRTLFESATEGIFLMTDVFLDCNEQVCRTLECTRKDLIGHRPEEFSPVYQPDGRTSREAAQERIDAALAGTPQHFYWQHLTRAGQRIDAEISLKKIILGQKPHLQAILRDITEQKRAEQEREKLIAELEAKNAELERFTYTVSHDLKSPLITTKGFIGMLEQDLAEGNEELIAEDMQRISHATEIMERLLEELLELSRIGRIMHPPEKVALSELAEEALGLLSGEPNIEHIDFAITPELPIVFGDRIRLREVLQNLIENAIKFMEDQPEPRIEIGIRQDEGEPVFFVRDNGIGIESRFHEKIFGLFDKLNSESTGTGIGLAIVKRIVEVHGGRIWVESQGSGFGSTFCFTLPPPPEGESVS